MDILSKLLDPAYVDALDARSLDDLRTMKTECADVETVVTVTLSAADLAAHRKRFPAMLDADAFELR